MRAEQPARAAIAPVGLARSAAHDALEIVAVDQPLAQQVAADSEFRLADLAERERDRAVLHADRDRPARARRLLLHLEHAGLTLLGEQLQDLAGGTLGVRSLEAALATLRADPALYFASRDELFATAAASLARAAEAGLELYPHQDEAVIELLSGNNVVLATPTGSGKSLVAEAAHRAALADDRVSFYTSPDLKTWSRTWEYVNPGIGTIECPDLFPIRADDGTLKWVFGVSANGYATNEPATFAYWTGSFDGTSFAFDQAAPLNSLATPLA